MSKFKVGLLFVLIWAVGLIYFLPPNRPFPGPPPDAVQSMEKADIESPLRQAYFTNYTRDQVVAHYAAQITQFPYLRLNYPPEDAQTIIRDQTRSWYLEELVQPFRQSIFVNGFIAQAAKDDIWYKGIHYEEKITIKLVQSTRVARLAVWSLSIITLYILSLSTVMLLSSLRKQYGKG